MCSNDQESFKEVQRSVPISLELSFYAIVLVQLQSSCTVYGQEIEDIVTVDRQIADYSVAISEDIPRARQSSKGEAEGSRHRAKELLPIPDDTVVWIMSEDQPVQGRVVSPADRPRSYVVETSMGQIERNQSQLRVIPEAESDQQIEVKSANENAVPSNPSRRIMTRSRTGTTVSKLDRLVQQV